MKIEIDYSFCLKVYFLSDANCTTNIIRVYESNNSIM